MAIWFSVGLTWGWSAYSFTVPPLPFFHTDVAFFSCCGADSQQLCRAITQLSLPQIPSAPKHFLDWDVSENPCSDPIPVPIAHLLLEPWLLVQGPWRSHQWRPRQERPWVTQPFFRALSLNHLPLQVHASIYILALQKLLWLPLNFVAHLEASWVLIFPTSFLCAQSMLLYSCLCN